MHKQCLVSRANRKLKDLQLIKTALGILTITYNAPMCSFPKRRLNQNEGKGKKRRKNPLSPRKTTVLSSFRSIPIHSFTLHYQRGLPRGIQPRRHRHTDRRPHPFTHPSQTFTQIEDMSRPGIVDCCSQSIHPSPQNSFACVIVCVCVCACVSLKSCPFRCYHGCPLLFLPLGAIVPLKGKQDNLTAVVLA